MVTVTRKWYLTLGHPKIHLHTKFGIPFSKNIGDMHQTQCSFWKQGQRSSSRSQWLKYGPRNFVIPRCIHTPNLRFLPRTILEICSGYNYSKNQVKGQGRSDPKNGMWHSTIPGWIKTQQICNSTYKNIGDMHRTRSGTDGQCDYYICLPTFLWGH